MTYTQIAQQMSEQDVAAQEWLDAKAREDKAKQDRLAAEEKIITLFGAKPEGSKTEKTDFFKVETTGNVTRSVDQSAIGLMKKSLPKKLFESVFKVKYDLSVSGVKKLQQENPELYVVVSACVTSKPAKASVKVSRIEQSE
jgi:hypothetical protein